MICLHAGTVLNSSRFLQELPEAVLEHSRVINHCPNYNHHKDLVNPGMGQLGRGCTRLLKRQESSFLLTLAVLIEGGAIGQDLSVLY